MLGMQEEPQNHFGGVVGARMSEEDVDQYEDVMLEMQREAAAADQEASELLQPVQQAHGPQPLQAAQGNATCSAQLPLATRRRHTKKSLHSC